MAVPTDLMRSCYGNEMCILTILKWLLDTALHKTFWLPCRIRNLSRLKSFLGMARHDILAELARHQTLKPVMVTVVSSISTGDNLYYLWKTGMTDIGTSGQISLKSQNIVHIVQIVELTCPWQPLSCKYCFYFQLLQPEWLTKQDILICNNFQT